MSYLSISIGDSQVFPSSKESELHWLNIYDRINFNNLLLTHKAVNNTEPEYLSGVIRFNVKSATIRTVASFHPCLLCVPPISKMCAISLFDRSFMPFI